MKPLNPHIAQCSYSSVILTSWKTDCMGELVLSLASLSATWSRTPAKLSLNDWITFGQAHRNADASCAVNQHMQYFGEYLFHELYLC